ncbi:MAG: hypothetical protein JWM80_1907 [Cyanobacteria bacterium RYN_339]|nr:hypothetical protein [Cyanobacteria bacterium RYN_339]
MRCTLVGILVIASLAGCKTPVAVGGATSTPVPDAAANFQQGQWMTTQLQVQKYRNALFRDKTTGKQLEPALVETKPATDVELEAGDFDEIFYAKGRLRYAFYGRTSEEQPFVVERVVTEADFNALEGALYENKFFSLPIQNWDAKTRLPLYNVLYIQGDKGYKSSFTPSLNKIPKFGALIDGYIGEMGGDAHPGKGVTQTTYAASGVNGQLSVTLSQDVVDKDGDLVESPIALKAVTYDAGAGPQPAQLPTSGKGNVFNIPQPTGTGTFGIVTLTVTPQGTMAPWSTAIPVRLKH